MTPHIDMCIVQYTWKITIDYVYNQFIKRVVMVASLVPKSLTLAIDR